jgi:LacI family transcriptional regulator
VSIRRPTIHDVAAVSGVSKTTVSNVIRGAGRVSAPTRARVLDSARTLGYRPNALARDLVRRRANAIGVIVGDMANSFYAELVKLVERRASEAELATMICNTDGHAELEAARIETLLERAVSGVVLLQFSGDGAVLDALAAAAVPAVVVSCWDARADCVAVDDHAGMALAVEHLAALGHRRIAFVSGPLIEAATHRARYAGYADAMRARELTPLPAGLDAAAVPGVTAYAAANDLIAVRLIDALEAAGLRVPGDVSVVGFDGTDLGAHPRIGLTTVAQPRAALIAHGVELLGARLRGHDGPPRGVRLAGELMVRTTTGAP